MNCDGCKRLLNPWDAHNCDECFKSFCSACHDDHTCGGSSGSPSKTNTLVSITPLTSTIKSKVLIEQFCALGSEKWREYIDFKLHDKGKTAIDEGQGPEGLREAFSENMDRGVEFATEYLGQGLTLAFYFELFRYCAGHLKKKKECRYRQRGDRITLGTDVRMSEAAVEELRSQSGAMKGVNDLTREQGGDVISMNFPDVMPDLIERLFGEFHLELGAAKDELEKRLLAIARLIQNLERLHPFRNANGRTNILLMNKLLTEWGFHPAILDDPNEAPFLSVTEWRDKIRKGMFRWAIFFAGLHQKSKVSFSSVPLFVSREHARQTVRIDGCELEVGSASGTFLECLFDSVRQGLPTGHAQGHLSATGLRDWLVTQYQQGRGGVVSQGHVLELSRGGMGNLTDDVPALAVLLRVRIRIFVQGTSGDVWLEFDSAGGTLPVINILHQGIHFVPIGVPGGLPRDEGSSLRTGLPRLELPRLEFQIPQSSPSSGLVPGGGSGGLVLPYEPSSKKLRLGGHPYSRRVEEPRNVSRIRGVSSSIRDSSPGEDRCDFCDHSIRGRGRRVVCVSSRPCIAWRLACEECYDKRRESYRCRKHK